MAEKPQIIDISLYQSQVDFGCLAKQGVGTIARAGQADFEDTMIVKHYAAAVAAGAAIGIYWFFQPDMRPEAQVEAFETVWKQMNPKPRVIALDVEDIVYGNVNVHPPSKEAHTLWLSIWLAEVEKLTGVRPGIYTRKNYWEQWTIPSRTEYRYNGATYMAPEWSRYWLWIAAWYNYTGQVPPELPRDWTDYHVHQYEGGTGRHPCVAGAVDRNYFNGSAEEMMAWFGTGAPVTPPGPDPSEIEAIKDRLDRLEKWAGSFLTEL